MEYGFLWMVISVARAALLGKRVSACCYAKLNIEARRLTKLRLRFAKMQSKNNDRVFAVGGLF